MANRIPERLSNFNVYLAGIKLLGVVDVTLPSLEGMSEEVKGAGIMGSFETATTGHFGSLTTTINFRLPTPEANILYQPQAHVLEFRAAIGNFNGNSGAMEQKGYRVAMRATPKNPDLGKMEVATAMDNSIEMEVLYLQVFYEGVETLLVDKPNFIYRVNGKDFAKDIRDRI